MGWKWKKRPRGGFEMKKRGGKRACVREGLGAIGTGTLRQQEWNLGGWGEIRGCDSVRGTIRLEP